MQKFEKTMYANRGNEPVMFITMVAGLVWRPSDTGLVADATINFIRKSGAVEVYSLELPKMRVVESGIVRIGSAHLIHEIIESCKAQAIERDYDDEHSLGEISGSFIKWLNKTLEYARPVVGDIIDHYSMSI